MPVVQGRQGICTLTSTGPGGRAKGEDEDGVACHFLDIFFFKKGVAGEVDVVGCWPKPEKRKAEAKKRVSCPLAALSAPSPLSDRTRLALAAQAALAATGVVFRACEKY